MGSPTFNEVKSVAGVSGASVTRFLPFIGGGAAILGGGVKSFAIVPQGHEGLRRHNGRLRVEDEHMYSRRGVGELYGDVGPGLHLVMPLTHSIETISTQNRALKLGELTVTSDSKRQYAVHARLAWGVVRRKDEQAQPKDYGIEYRELLYKAIMAARDPDDLEANLAGICEEGLRQIIDGKYEPINLKARSIQPELIALCGDELLKTYGSEIRRLNIVNTPYTPLDHYKFGGQNPWDAALDMPAMETAVPEAFGGQQVSSDILTQY